MEPIQEYATSQIFFFHFLKHAVRYSIVFLTTLIFLYNFIDAEFAQMDNGVLLKRLMNDGRVWSS